MTRKTKHKALYTVGGEENKFIPPMWRHQQRALDRAIRDGAVYLNMKMGEGKSRVIIEYCESINARLVLVVAPKSAVLSVWHNEFRKYARRKYSVLCATAAGSTIAKRVEEILRQTRRSDTTRAPLVVAVNYDMLRSSAAMTALQGIKWDVCAFDEAHRIKSPAGATSKAAARLTAKIPRKLMLSGTPMPHSPMDIWAQYRALDPNVLGASFVRFRMRYGILGGYKNKQVVNFQNLDELKVRLDGRMFAPMPGEVQLDLPEFRHEKITVDLSPEARGFYDCLENDIAAEIGTGTINASNALVKLLRLQQLCSGLAVTEERQHNHTEPDTRTPFERILDASADGAERGARTEKIVCTAKEDALADILEDTDEPVVVFGLYRHDINITRAAAQRCDALCSEVSGRENTLADWQAGKTRVLAVQIATGSEAIDLTRARICVYLSTGFNLGQYLQSEKRVHRPGQKRAVVYYHIHARNSVDQLVWRALRKRTELVTSVLAGIGQRKDETDDAEDTDTKDTDTEDETETENNTQ